ncbi:MAG: TetR/AcrR family transcriptional regulator [Myxococcota bacterium]
MTYTSHMKQRRGEQTRARIAAAALEILRERGSAGLTMRRVAVRTGLALSNVQYHYGSREALLVGLTDHHLALCRDALVRGVERAGPVTLRAVLEVSLCDAEALASASAFRELFALARTEPKVHERLVAHYQQGFSDMIGLLAQTWPSSPEDALAEVATILLTSLEGSYLLADVTPVTGRRLADRLEGVAVALLGS